MRHTCQAAVECRSNRWQQQTALAAKPCGRQQLLRALLQTMRCKTRSGPQKQQQKVSKQLHAMR